MDARRPSVLLIASDTIGERMAGSGIRYWNLARVLGAQQPVTLASPNESSLDAPLGVTLVTYTGSEDERGRTLAELVGSHEVVVAQHLPYLYTDAEVLASRALVVDLYAPWIVEKLEYSRVDPERGEPDRKDDVTILNRLLTLGDFFLCASERQRDFWLGALATAGRLDLVHAQANPDLRTLIDIVPFGLPPQKPVRTGPGPREIFDGLGEDSVVALWNGGLWNWLDPLTAIRAAAIVAAGEPRFKLVFMGTRSPGAQVAEMEIAGTARALAGELGLLDTHVFFNDWVNYEERQNWLLESDLALSLHVATVEARYAYRTRMLDNIWCGLPSVVTAGDVLADLVVEQDIGEVAPPGNVAAVAAAIERAIDRDRARGIRANLATLAGQYTWEIVSRPLLDYCANPWAPGTSRDNDEAGAYLHRLERLYSETAGYARHLEQVVGEKDHLLAEMGRAASHPPRRVLTRPDLGSLFRRDKRG
ncbi:MAG TPA: glycosyltransferase [Thermomicrobiales bacterium]|nr:glycosyltransferase [Thermomicrobiales bacterium]